jgi:hypothetical protein
VHAACSQLVAENVSFSPNGETLTSSATGWRRTWNGVPALLLFFACCIVPARAQAPAAARVVRFTVFAAKPIPEISFFPRTGAAPQKLQFYPTARSPRYEYRGAMPLKFVDAAGAVIAEATIPSNIRDPLLLFTPIESPAGGVGSLKYQIALLDDGAARHGAGGLAILNLSGLVLSGTVGNEKVTLKPGLNPTLPIGKSAKVTLSTTFKNRTYQSYASTVTLGRNERALLILFPPFYTGALEVQSRLLLDQPPGSMTSR